MDKSVSVTLDGREHVVQRARLGTYLTLEAIVLRLRKATKTGDNGGICNELYDYLSTCVPELTRAQFYNMPWYEIVNAYISIETMNLIEGEFAILRHSGKDESPVPWDHPERLKTLWVHMIAKSYNWKKDDIENLWVEEAIGFIQEIEADDQLAREFHHSLSEVAYTFDAATKKMKFVPLHRPPWMVIRDEETVKTRLVRSLLPVGKVVHVDGTESIMEMVVNKDEEDDAHKEV